MDERDFKDIQEIPVEPMPRPAYVQDRTERPAPVRSGVRTALRVLAGIGLTLLLIAALCGAFYLGMLVERNTPATTVMSLREYYDAEDEDVLVIMDTQLQDWSARVFVEGVYLPFDKVQELFLPRLYHDTYDDLVLLTTPTRVFIYPVGSSTCTINEEPWEMGYPVVKRADGQLWIALEYLQQEVDMDAYWSGMPEDMTISSRQPDPGRLVLFTAEGEILQKEVRKATQVRTKADVKGDILKELEKGEWVYVLASEDERFDRVMTRDGVIGYVRSKMLSEGGYAKLSYADRIEDKPEAYTTVEREGPVVLVWHQVFNQTANSYLAEKLAQTEGVNVVSPTWFGIENNNGKLTTLANREYVELAHSMGIEVWPVVNDFTAGLDYDRIFGSETCRRNLINNIFWFIYEYDLDGINIDFENITEENSRGYIQFLRELSVACRNEGIVLSVDNYVPMEHTAFYDRAEQGVLADYVIVMAYDEHYAGSPVAGSVSSLSWVERGIVDTLAEVPEEKLVVALPYYTRLWKYQTGEDGSVNLYSEACSMNAGLNLVAQNGAEMVWDETTGQYYATWQSGNTTCQIWLEEERSLEAKLDIVSGYESIGGVAFWKLGLERAEVWAEVMEWKD